MNLFNYLKNLFSGLRMRPLGQEKDSNIVSSVNRFEKELRLDDIEKEIELKERRLTILRQLDAVESETLKNKEFLSDIKKIMDKEESLLSGGQWKEEIELLHRTIVDVDKPRENDPDKKNLFSENRHPHSAQFYREEWDFIQDAILRANIAYQMQYIEWCIYLYNDYRIYLSIESLLMKNIALSISAIVEASLKDILSSWAAKGNFQFDWEAKFSELIRFAYDSRLIDWDTKEWFHKIRKLRNALHIENVSEREHIRYSPESINRFLVILETFRAQQKKENPKLPKGF